MSPPKKWFLEPQEDGSLEVLYADGTSPRKNGIVFDLAVPHQLPNSPSAIIPNYALEVSFVGGIGAIVLRTQNFLWSKNDFCQLFRGNTNTSTAFISIWTENTLYSESHGTRIWKTFDIQDDFREYESEIVASFEADNSLDDTIQNSTELSSMTTSSSEAEKSPIVVSLGTKRGQNSKDSNASKRSHQENDSSNPMDVEIEMKKIKGLHVIPTTNCVQPHTNRLLRKLDETFVQSLKENLKKDPTGPGAPPLALLCKSVKTASLFKESHKRIYSYEVLGGLHALTARSKLLKEFPDNSEFANVQAAIYCGLTDEEALRLAVRHNINGHYMHKMKHRDYIEACRSRLYLMAGKDNKTEPTPQSNTHWKKTCSTCILPSDMSKTQRENIFAQASFPLKTWKMAVLVMDKFEKGTLKGQKLSQKQLIMTPEFKQHLLQPLHHLNEQFQTEVLEKVANGHLSLGEMKLEASRNRSLTAIKSAFLRTVNCGTWEEAKDKFPHHANVDRLQAFSSLSFKGGLPSVFRDYCQSAITSTRTNATPGLATNITTEGAWVRMLSGALTNLTGENIMEEIPEFKGGNLIFGSLTKEMSEDDMKALGFTVRQVNSVSASLECFNLVLITRRPVQDIFKLTDALNCCFDYTEIAYAIKSSETSSIQSNINAGRTLTPAVTGIIVAHWSQDGQLSPRHVRGEHTDAFIYTSYNQLYQSIIDIFSYPGNTVVDITPDNTLDAIPKICITMQRNCVVVHELPETAATIMKSVSERSETST